MIALKDDMPLVQYEGGEVTAFDAGWLTRRLVHAAEKAGYPQWWLAEHVAASVTNYLRYRFAGNVLPAPRLAEAVHSALQVIGYAEVASHFEAGPPPARVSLLELAKKAGSGYELAFFELLARGMQQLLAARAPYLELCDLEACVKELRSRKVWARDCQALREEIVTFLRDHFAAAAHPVTFSVS
ncbi:MAG TPA: hypothetical protein VHY22_06600 [Chthoniobacteraceae bacterium]|jgi:hypothetical protein|nr:hypothetical protein [Chthoniobacteraceae bacterium]